MAKTSTRRAPTKKGEFKSSFLPIPRATPMRASKIGSMATGDQNILNAPKGGGGRSASGSGRSKPKRTKMY